MLALSGQFNCPRLVSDNGGLRLRLKIKTQMGFETVSIVSGRGWDQRFEAIKQPPRVYAEFSRDVIGSAIDVLEKSTYSLALRLGQR